MKKLYNRWQEKAVKSALKTRRVLLLNGARQCGKTTLAKEITKNGTEYRTLDNQALRKLAINDPQGFVKHTGKTHSRR